MWLSPSIADFTSALFPVTRGVEAHKRVEQLEAMDVNFLLFSNAFLFCVFAIFLSFSSE